MQTQTRLRRSTSPGMRDRYIRDEKFNFGWWIVCWMDVAGEWRMSESLNSCESSWIFISTIWVSWVGLLESKDVCITHIPLDSHPLTLFAVGSGGWKKKFCATGQDSLALSLNSMTCSRALSNLFFSRHNRKKSRSFQLEHTHARKYWELKYALLCLLLPVSTISPKMMVDVALGLNNSLSYSVGRRKFLGTHKSAHTVEKICGNFPTAWLNRPFSVDFAREEWKGKSWKRHASETRENSSCLFFRIKSHLCRSFHVSSWASFVSYYIQRDRGWVERTLHR